MVRERLFSGLHVAGSEPARSSTQRWQWIFPVMIVVGLILVLAALLYLTGTSASGVIPES